MPATPEPPWVYAYGEEARRGGATFLERPLLRPVVYTRLCNGDRQTQKFQSLVDSGCDHVLAPAWVAETIGVEPDENRSLRARIGGQTREIRFATVTAELFAPSSADDVVASWETTVGFFTHWADPPWVMLLGQVGFFDQFTVTMSRFSQSIAIDTQARFDDWHPPGATNTLN